MSHRPRAEASACVSGSSEVLVVDSAQRFVGYVHRAVARRALRDGKVRIWKKAPFVLMLPPGESSLDVFGPEARSAARKKDKMTSTPRNDNTDGRERERFSQLYPQSVGPSSTGVSHGQGPVGVGAHGMGITAGGGTTVLNWNKFFAEERDIWIQNISATLLSMQFEVAQGQLSSVSVGVSPDPLCLTQHVPFDAIKRSIDFRKLVNRTPAIMRLLTEDDVMRHFADKAKANNLFAVDPETGTQVPDIARAVQLAEQERLDALHVPLPVGELPPMAVNAAGQVMFSPPRSAQELMGIIPSPDGGGFGGMPAYGAFQQMAMQGGGVMPGGMGPFGSVQATAYGATPAQMAMQAMAQSNLANQQFSSLGQLMQATGIASTAQTAAQLAPSIHPKVQHLCGMVSTEAPPGLQMPYEQFLRELKSLGSILRLPDLHYVQARAAHVPGLLQWAAERAQALGQQGGTGQPGTVILASR